MSEQFLIWSLEHGAWWRNNAMGYTHALNEAGRYNLAETDKILDRANFKTTHECAIPADSVIDYTPCPHCGAPSRWEVMP